MAVMTAVTLALALLLVGVVAGPVRAEGDDTPPPDVYVPQAVAAEPERSAGDCPDPEDLVDYEGEDEQLLEVRELRRDLRLICGALADRQDEQLTRGWWAITEQLRAQEQGAALLKVLQEVHGQGHQVREVKVVAPSPLPVEDAAALQYGSQLPSLLEEDDGKVIVEDPETHAQLVANTESTDAAAEMESTALWALIGSVIGALIVAAIWGVWKRAAD